MNTEEIKQVTEKFDLIFIECRKSKDSNQGLSLFNINQVTGGSSYISGCIGCSTVSSDMKYLVVPIPEKMLDIASMTSPTSLSDKQFDFKNNKIIDLDASYGNVNRYILCDGKIVGHNKAFENSPVIKAKYEKLFRENPDDDIENLEYEFKFVTLPQKYSKAFLIRNEGLIKEFLLTKSDFFLENIAKIELYIDLDVPSDIISEEIKYISESDLIVKHLDNISPRVSALLKLQDPDYKHPEQANTDLTDIFLACVEKDFEKFKSILPKVVSDYQVCEFATKCGSPEISEYFCQKFTEYVKLNLCEDLCESKNYFALYFAIENDLEDLFETIITLLKSHDLKPFLRCSILNYNRKFMEKILKLSNNEEIKEYAIKVAKYAYDWPLVEDLS